MLSCAHRRSYGDLRRHLYADDGKLRSFVNIYVNDDDIRYLRARKRRALEAGDSISIVPSVAGGAPVDARRTALPELTNDEVQRYSRHLIMPRSASTGSAS